MKIGRVIINRINSIKNIKNICPDAIKVAPNVFDAIKSAGK